MKKMLAIILMVPTLVFSNSEEKTTIKNTKVECVSINSLDEILKEFDELPFVRGISNRNSGQTTIQNSLVLFVNAKTGSWSLVEKTNDGLYCFLAVGMNFEPVPSEIIDKLQNKRQRFKS
jgi:hypothetical protein